jgi:hypothetical protein
MTFLRSAVFAIFAPTAMMEFLLISSMCAQRDPLYALADSCGGDASDDLQQLNPLGRSTSCVLVLFRPG